MPFSILVYHTDGKIWWVCWCICMNLLVWLGVWLYLAFDAYSFGCACRMLGSSGSGWVISRRLLSSWPCFLCSAPLQPLDCITLWRLTTAGNPAMAAIITVFIFSLKVPRFILQWRYWLNLPTDGVAIWAKLGSDPESKVVHCNPSMIYNIYRYIICLYGYLFIQNLSSLYNVELWRRFLVPV